MNLIHTGFKYKDLKFQSVNLFTKQQRLISNIIRPCRIEHKIIGHAALPIPASRGGRNKIIVSLEPLIWIRLYRR